MADSIISIKILLLTHSKCFLKLSAPLTFDLSLVLC